MRVPEEPPPRTVVPRVDGGRETARSASSWLDASFWERAGAVGPRRLADGSGVAAQRTEVRLAWDARGLYVRFECADRDAWGTYRRRNDPIYLEEVVEVFLAPGEAAPRRYWELEVSPLGTLFDAWIDNPDGRRDTLRADPGWDCPGLRWEVGRGGAREDWWAALALPWSALSPDAGPGGPPPALWRANLYRIERPRDGSPPEFSAWSPTLADPPDFHRPARFGSLELAASPPSPSPS